MFESNYQGKFNHSTTAYRHFASVGPAPSPGREVLLREVLGEVGRPARRSPPTVACVGKRTQNSRSAVLQIVAPNSKKCLEVRLRDRFIHHVKKYLQIHYYSTNIKGSDALVHIGWELVYWTKPSSYMGTDIITTRAHACMDPLSTPSSFFLLCGYPDGPGAEM